MKKVANAAALATAAAGLTIGMAGMAPSATAAVTHTASKRVSSPVNKKAVRSGHASPRNCTGSIEVNHTQSNGTTNLRFWWTKSGSNTCVGSVQETAETNGSDLPTKYRVRVWHNGALYWSKTTGSISESGGTNSIFNLYAWIGVNEYFPGPTQVCGAYYFNNPGFQAGWQDEDCATVN
jgi:hypothetical protein